LAEAIYHRDRTGVRFGFHFGAGHRWGYHQPGPWSAERSASRLQRTRNRDRALCDAERHKGEAAERRLRELVSSGSPAFQQIACSCKSATEGTNACNFGRRCGTLQVNGVDVGATLISEGLAVRFVCGATSCPKLPRPWCRCRLYRIATHNRGGNISTPKHSSRLQKDSPGARLAFAPRLSHCTHSQTDSIDPSDFREDSFLLFRRSVRWRHAINYDASKS